METFLGSSADALLLLYASVFCFPQGWVYEDEVDVGGRGYPGGGGVRCMFYSGVVVGGFVN